MNIRYEDPIEIEQSNRNNNKNWNELNEIL